MFKYFSDKKVKKQKLGFDFVPSVQKIASEGLPPYFTPEQYAHMLKGFKECGVIAAAKHFPGRGDSATDAHHACPMLNVDSDRFNKVELYPYKRLIEAGIDAIMVAH